MLTRATLRLTGTSTISRSQIVHPIAISAISRHYASSSKPPPPPAYNAKSKAKATPAPRTPAAASTGSSVQGSRPKVGSAATSSAQSSKQLDGKESIRAETQNQQAAAENTPPPPSKPAQPLPDLRQGIPSTFDFEFGGKSKEKADLSSLDITEADGESAGKRGSEEDNYNRADFETSVDRRRAKIFGLGYYVVAFAALFGGVYYGRPFANADEIPAGTNADDATGWSPDKMYRRVRARFGDQMGYYTEPAFPKLLPDVPADQRAPYTLVLSLEDLMVHSAWDRNHGYRMAKRPGIDYFIRYLSPYYELVLFTSVPIGIADPVIKKLDPFHFIMWPLGREATKYDGGDFVKDLSYLNRDLKKTLIIDTVPGHVKNQPENAIVLPKWNGNPQDTNTNDLVALIPFLEYIATMNIDDVRDVIKSFEGKHIPTEFARREAIAREQFQKQLGDRKRPSKSIGSLFGSGLGIKGERAMAGGPPSMSEGLTEGKMLSDQIREQGLKQYEALDKQIREQGEQWLKDEADEMKRMMDKEMKEMKQNPIGALARFWGAGPPPSAPESK